MSLPSLGNIIPMFFMEMISVFFTESEMYRSKCIIYCFDKYLYYIIVISIRIKNISVTPESSFMLPAHQLSTHMWPTKWSGCLPHSGKINYWGNNLLQEEKTLFLGGQARRQEAMLRSVSLIDWLPSRVLILEEGARWGGGFENDWWKVSVNFHLSLKSALHRQTWLLFMPLHRSHVQIWGWGKGFLL